MHNLSPNYSIGDNFKLRSTFVLYALRPTFVLQTMGQFHQHSTSSFYMRRSQKRKKDWQLDCLFCAFRICKRKSFSYNVDEIDTMWQNIVRKSTNAKGAHKMMMKLIRSHVQKLKRTSTARKRDRANDWNFLRSRYLWREKYRRLKS